MWELPRPFGQWVDARFLAEGGVLPRGYGVAWACPYSHRYYCLPVQLNRIAGSFRAWWLQIRRPCKDDPILAAYTYGRNVGFQQGNDHGYTQGIEHALIARKEVEAELARLRADLAQLIETWQAQAEDEHCHRFIRETLRELAAALAAVIAQGEK